MRPVLLRQGERKYRVYIASTVCLPNGKGGTCQWRILGRSPAPLPHLILGKTKTQKEGNPARQAKQNRPPPPPPPRYRYRLHVKLTKTVRSSEILQGTEKPPNCFIFGHGQNLVSPLVSTTFSL